MTERRVLVVVGLQLGNCPLWYGLVSTHVHPVSLLRRHARGWMENTWSSGTLLRGWRCLMPWRPLTENPKPAARYGLNPVHSFFPARPSWPKPENLCSQASGTEGGKTQSCRVSDELWHLWGRTSLSLHVLHQSARKSRVWELT